MAKFSVLTLTAALAVALSACGGGGGSSPSTPGVTLSGTAATGAAIKLAPVSIKCAVGTVTGTTADDGTFSLTVPNGNLPCMLQVTSTDGATVLYSVADGTGTGTATANITPLTDLVVAKALGGTGTPSDAFAGYAPATSNPLPSANLTSAKTAVTAALSSVISITSDPLTTTFKVGDATDDKLELLKAALTTANTTLAQLENAVVTSQATSGTTPAAPITAILTPPPLSVCASVRNGTYVTIDQRGNVNTHSWVLSASGGRSTESDGSVTTFNLVLDGTCHITGTTASGRVNDVVFNSTESFGIYRSTPSNSSDSVIGVVFPMQAIAQSDIAGNWNAFAFNNSGNGSFPEPGVAALAILNDGTTSVKACTSSAGTFDCTGTASGTSFTNKFTVGISGLATTASGDTMYPFRASDGSLILIGSAPGASGVNFFARQRTLALPAVGKVSNYWTAGGTASSSNASVFTSTATVAKTTTVTAVDTTKNSFTRDDGYTFLINTPLNGMRYRPAGTNTTGAYKSQVQLRVGTFLTVFGNEKATSDTGSSFGLSLDK